MDDQVGLVDIIDGQLRGLAVQGLLVEDHIGLDDPAAAVTLGNPDLSPNCNLTIDFICSNIELLQMTSIGAMDMKRLPDTELEVMKALWSSGPDTPRSLLEDKLSSFGWAANTVNTYLSRLADKGFVSARRVGKSNLYTPLVTQEEYQAFDSRAVLDRLYGSPRNFVAALAREGLEDGELEELQALLDQLSGGKP